MVEGIEACLFVTKGVNICSFQDKQFEKLAGNVFSGFKV